MLHATSFVECSSLRTAIFFKNSQEKQYFVNIFTE
jgi:hypothetical protein